MIERPTFQHERAKCLGCGGPADGQFLFRYDVDYRWYCVPCVLSLTVTDWKSARHGDADFSDVSGGESLFTEDDRAELGEILAKFVTRIAVRAFCNRIKAGFCVSCGADTTTIDYQCEKCRNGRPGRRNPAKS